MNNTGISKFFQKKFFFNEILLSIEQKHNKSYEHISFFKNIFLEYWKLRHQTKRYVWCKWASSSDQSMASNYHRKSMIDCYLVQTSNVRMIYDVTLRHGVNQAVQISSTDNSMETGHLISHWLNKNVASNYCNSCLNKWQDPKKFFT